MSDGVLVQPTQAVDISVVVPVYLNEGTLTELAERLVRTLEVLPGSFELIFVNDASPDDCTALLTHLQTRFPQIRTIESSTNSGQQNAIRAGLKVTTGDVVAVMDADLQDPPEAISDLYRALQAGDHEAVFAQRSKRYQNRRRMISSKLFKWLVYKMVNLPRGTGCFLIMSNTMVAAVLSFGTRRFYLPGLVAKTKLPISSIPVQRMTRVNGQSAYSAPMRMSVAISNIRCLLERK